MNRLTVLGVDIGIRHLGLAIVESAGVGVRCATHLECVNIMQYTHNHLPAPCDLPHTNETADRLMHAVAERRPLFDGADVIAIERQPITGLQCIQALLFHEFRDKARLVHPNTLHARHRLRGLNYEERKRHFVGWASMWVRGWESRTQYMERKHDVADALAIADLVGDEHWTERADRERAVMQRASRRRAWKECGLFDQYHHHEEEGGES